MFEIQRGKLEVVNDGKNISFIDVNGRERWARGRPSKTEWFALTGKDADVDNGSYFYSGEEVDGLVYAIFTPADKLDFVVDFCVDTGNIVSIHEAR